MNKQFSGRVALVTGGTAGIGRACAIALAREGARVVISGRRQSAADETLAAIRAVDGDAHFVRADIGIHADIKALVEQVVAKYGRLDFAINNAATEGPARVPATEYPEEAWDEVMNVNLKGLWLCMKYEIPHLLKQDGSAIVNMASVGGLIGGGLGVAYHASKHGVIGLTKTVALEYAAKGLRVNAVAPATIATEMADRLFQDPNMNERVKAAHPLKRIGTVEEVASAALWLCSAGFVTGHTLPVDGGLLAQ